MTTCPCGVNEACFSIISEMPDAWARDCAENANASSAARTTDVGFGFMEFSPDGESILALPASLASRCSSVYPLARTAADDLSTDASLLSGCSGSSLLEIQVPRRGQCTRVNSRTGASRRRDRLRRHGHARVD